MLFKKAAIFTDIHIGLKSNSITHLEDCIKYTEWFIQESHKNNCDVCLFLGDLFHNRNSINLLAMNYGLRCLRLLSDAFDQTIMITGNHDQFYKDQRTVHSMEWASHIPNITVVNEITQMDNCYFVPWMINGDAKKVQKLKTQYIFGHFELPSFYMNSMVQMPDVGELHAKDFSGVDHMYTGHFHKRQTYNNITYLGNAFPHNYADAWDDERGMGILEPGKQIVYKMWPDTPKYRTFKLSDLVDDKIKLEANTYARVTLDVDISYEESNYIKDTVASEYKLRELAFVPMKNDNYDVESSVGDLNFETVDQIVTQQITNINSDFYNVNTLLEIYNQL